MGHSGDMQGGEPTYGPGAGPGGIATSAVADGHGRGGTPPGGASTPGALPASCLDCGAPLTGRFCANCGQPAGDAQLSLRKLLGELADEYLNVDSRFFRSIVPLLVRPGFLTREYLQGRRTRYVRPLRLYLVSSLVFFFLFSLGSGRVLVFSDTSREELEAMRAEMLETTAALRDSTLAETAARMGVGQTPAPGDDAARTAPASEAADATSPGTPAGDSAAPGAGRTPDGQSMVEVSGLGGARRIALEGDSGASEPRDTTAAGRFVTRWLLDRAERLGEVERQAGAQGIGQILKRELAQQAPTMIFLLLPVFALLLKLLYIRSGRSYVEHLIFGLHSHAFTYLVLLVLLVAGKFRPLDLALTGVVVGYAFTRIVKGYRASPVRLVLYSLGLLFLAWRVELSTMLLWWIPAYLFLSMREVYGQSKLKTAVKFAMLSTCYMTVLSIAVALEFVIILARL